MVRYGFSMSPYLSEFVRCVLVRHLMLPVACLYTEVTVIERFVMPLASVDESIAFPVD